MPPRFPAGRHRRVSASGAFAFLRTASQLRQWWIAPVSTASNAVPATDFS